MKTIGVPAQAQQVCSGRIYPFVWFHPCWNERSGPIQHIRIHRRTLVRTVGRFLAQHQAAVTDLQLHSVLQSLAGFGNIFSVRFTEDSRQQA